MGGGGGCGSCNSVNSDSTDEYNRRSRRSLLHRHSNYTNDHSDIRSRPLGDITCGNSADEDSMTRSQTPMQVASRIQSFTQYLSSSCDILEVVGGGGGGGGTAECALPLSYGYGFSFSYISKRSVAGVRGDSTEYRSRGNIRASRLRSTEDADRNDQFIYDIAGALLKDASVVCGGYTDWCCVSSQAGKRIRQCLSPDDSQTILPAESSTVSCDTIEKARTSVSWLLSASGCNSTEQIETQRDKSDAGGSEGKCSGMQNTSYPFAFDNNSEDEGIRRDYRRYKISRMRACLKRDQQLDSSREDGGTVDLSWATYSTSLTPSELFSSDNLYIEDGLYCIDSPHNLSSAFCGNRSTFGYCDSDGNFQKVQKSALTWSDLFQESVLGSFPSDPQSVNVTMAFTLQSKGAESSTNILFLVFIALIILNTFTFFIKSLHPYNRVFEI